jgi:hypothetical protein
MNKRMNNDYFYELAENDPEEVRQQALCTYDPQNRSYLLSVWGEDFGIYPHECKIIRIQNNDFVTDEFFGVFIAHYLLKAKESEVKKEWISEKDLPGGPMFFRGMHEIPTPYIVKKYGDDFQKFNNVCQQHHGIRLAMADAVYSFRIASRIPVFLQFWEKDDEFMAECKMRFDRSISDHLTLDVIFGLSVVVCNRITKCCS